MFRETVHHAGGATQGIASEAHALLILRRGARRGCHIEASTDGGVLVSWTRREPRGALAHRSISLVPQMPVGTLTDAVLRDLAAVAGLRPARYGRDSIGRRVILAGLAEIGATRTAALRARQLVTDDRAGAVRLTLTARLGMLAAAHRTTTTEPHGWDRAGALSAGLNRPGGRAGMLRSSASAATCSCGQLHAWGGDRDEARRLGRDHRRDMARAFVEALPVDFTTAVTA
ncbi:hypothetical protein ACH4Q7_22605 [Streptomyces roseolus]|uniref:hypothetical protein n=1 Tax=Streptomyces roseolus TaxID=67358 RepID=UPI0037A43ADF